MRRHPRFRSDPQNGALSQLKLVRSSKNVKSDLLFLLRKNNNRAGLTRRLVYKLNVLSNPTRRNRNLDFRSKNSKNVFARTKRKSSYGQTLLASQRLQNYMSFSKDDLKKYYLRHKKNLFPSLEERPTQLAIRSGLYLTTDAKRSLRAHSDSLGMTSLAVDGEGVTIPVLVAKKKEARDPRFLRKTPIFNQPPSHWLLLDLRLNKAAVCSDVCNLSYPFKLSLVKALQHFRLRRG